MGCAELQGIVAGGCEIPWELFLTFLFLFFRLRLVRAALQAFELLHFMLRLCRLSLFTIEAGQSEMRLRRQWTLLFDGEKVDPGFLSGCGITVERSRFSQCIQGFRHLRH